MSCQRVRNNLAGINEVLTGLSRRGMSYLGMRTRWDFIIVFKNLGSHFDVGAIVAIGKQRSVNTRQHRTVMSHSTTATSTFVLRKYSRSYPTVSASEWQHYVNPTIRLSVDSRNASNGELESVRLRIVWSMDNGEGSGGSQVLFVRLHVGCIVRILRAR